MSYYGAVPINLNLNTNVKKEIFSDSENVKNYNELVVIDNVLTGNRNFVTGIGTTTFSLVFLMLLMNLNMIQLIRN